MFGAEPTEEPLLDHDAMSVPEWLSDEDCFQELGSDWCRRGGVPAREDME